MGMTLQGWGGGWHFLKCFTRHRTWTDHLEWYKQQKLAWTIKQRTWEISLGNGQGTLKTVGRELVKYRLVSLRVQEVRWDSSELCFCMWKKKWKSAVEGRLFTVRAVKRVQFASFRASFSAERSVVNAHVPSEDTTDESEDSFCK